MLELFAPPARPIEPGAGFVARAGCDKQFATCKAKFANALNFRGFPHMPGDDVVMRYPNRGDANSGRVL
ncbi:MAG TPA: phage BR0599 family protein [Paracoccaceae bacterium]|nr:phage BR0599 family protein [Paracoccaceae bacterium]